MINQGFLINQGFCINQGFSINRGFLINQGFFDKPGFYENILIMELYFLDDGSLVINKARSTTLIPPDQFEIVRTIGCHYLSQLSEKEAHDLLVEQNFSLVKNGLSSGTKCKEPVGTGIKKVE